MSPTLHKNLMSSSMVSEKSKEEACPLVHSPQSVVILPDSADSHEASPSAFIPELRLNDPGTWKTIEASQKALRTHNPIRAVVESVLAKARPCSNEKPHISLALGDPTAAGNMPPCPVAVEAVRNSVSSSSSYVPACGTTEARKAIAEYHSHYHPVEEKHVIVASGCSGALELALTALLNPNDILLVPAPGFSLYQVIAESHGAQVLHYRLLPDKQWQIDLDHVQELLEQHKGAIKGIVVNTPSNPTGAVYTEEHLQDVCRVCRDWQIPVISDEIYGELSFKPFVSVARVASSFQVPVIVASGLGKQFLVPGWRLGWLCVYDNDYGTLTKVEQGCKNLAQVILGASHLIQKSVPLLLDRSNESLQTWKADIVATLQTQSNLLEKELRGVPGLIWPSRPEGAMYALLQLDLEVFEDIADDQDYCRMLLEEENLLVLPGSAGLGAPGMIRLVTASSPETIHEAAARMMSFGQCHASVPN